MKYQVGEEVYFRHCAGLSEGPVRIVRPLKGVSFFFDYEIIHVGDTLEVKCWASEDELSPLTAVGAMRAP